jgi:hypothetical protein
MSRRKKTTAKSSYRHFAIYVPKFFPEDFVERVKRVVASKNKTFAADGYYRKLSVNTYILEALREKLERDEKILDRKKAK